MLKTEILLKICTPCDFESFSSILLKFALHLAYNQLSDKLNNGDGLLWSVVLNVYLVLILNQMLHYE